MSIPTWLHPLIRLLGLWMIFGGARAIVSYMLLLSSFFDGARQTPFPSTWWVSAVITPSIELAAGLWFFFGTRHVISIVMRGRFAAHCCQHCGYDPGPNRPERCPECARAFPVNQSEPPSSPPASS